MANAALRAGHKVTIADFDAIGIWALKTSNESVTSSTTLQNDDQLVLPVAANAKYTFEMFLVYDGAGAGLGDLKRDFTGPAGIVMNYANYGPNNSGAGLTQYDVVMDTLSGVSRVLGTNGATAMTAQPKGYVATSGTAGNLQFRWAQNVSSATATRVLVGSFMKLTRIA